jgi:energy-converting hydrogenase B subunit D
MSAIIAMSLLLVAGTGTAIVLTRDPGRQIFALALNGVALTLLFTLLQAPDVALSEIAVGTAAVPLLFFIALTAVRTQKMGEKP